MYAHFYQLSENPFNLTPDPKFHYVNTSTREAMASILHGVKSRKGFITLIAEAGTGKTTLLKRIVDEIEGETQVVFVFNPGVSFDELLEFICSELGIETHGCKRLHLLDRLNTHLLEQLTRGRNVVVMIDEAQTLEDSVLEELRLLSNLETAKEKILQILLSGQPELEEKLRKPSLRQLRQRIGVRATLKPVRLEEMPAYVETRLKSAGAERNELFTAAALKKIWQASGGIPRVINVICDNAMMLAFADGKKRITPKLLREAVRDLEGEVSAEALSGGAPEWLSSRTTGYALAAAAVIAAAIPLVSFLQSGIDVSNVFSSPSERIEVAAAMPDVESDASTPDAGMAADRKNDEAGARDGAPAVKVEPTDGPATREVEAESLRALQSDASTRPTIVDSMRRAEIVARSTAARLYGNDQDAAGASDRRDIADAAMEEVSRDGGLKAPNLKAVPPAAGVDRAPADDELPDPQPTTPAAMPAPEPARERAAIPPVEVAQPAIPESVEAETKPEPKPATVAAAKTPEKPAKSEAKAKEKKPAPKAEAKPQPKPEPAEAAPVPTPTAASGIAAVEDDPVKAAIARAAQSNADAHDTETSATAAAAAAASQQVAAMPPRGSFVLGRSVRVSEGDTIWDIAIKHYGSAGSSVLKRILASNPAVRDPSRLEVGSTVFLPFSRPEQMVRKDASGFRVVLASGTSRERLEAVGRWANSVASEVRMTSASSSLGPVLYEVSIVGLPSEAAALSLATNLFESSATTSAERTAMR